jgi:molybdopterin-guanine dinucleotide biosynthesis protein A
VGVIIDAIVLAGGRASRLGGSSKAALTLAGTSLLEITLASLASARRVVVVGDEADILAAVSDASTVREFATVRETPAFAGPAAAIAAGLGKLDGTSDFTVVVGCDMPAVGAALDVLLAAVSIRSDGAVAISADGRPQQLVGVYSTHGLAKCVASHRDAGDLENLSVRALLSGLDPVPVTVPDGSTDDVDTWADAERFGILVAHSNQTKD